MSEQLQDKVTVRGRDDAGNLLIAVPWENEAEVVALIESA